MRDLGSRGLLAAAVAGIVWGLVGCTSGLDGRYGAIGDEPYLWAPAPSAEIARPLASADIGRRKNTGWRMGPLYLTGRLADWLQGANREGDWETTGKGEEYIDKGAVPWLFTWGYQFEFVRGQEGQMSTLVTILPLIAGMDKSLFIPTVNLLVGLRSPSGKWDFGAGPYYAPRVYSGKDELGEDEYPDDDVHLWGLGLTVGLGYTIGVDSPVRVPIGLAVGFAGDATAYSLTIGWNMEEW